MEQGLAATVTSRYGNGEGNTQKHFYAGSNKTPKKEQTMACKTKKKK